MPAVRFSRDKRGYEYVYLVHTPMRRGKPGRSRVLYWYRTPPGVRIGRQPFDPDVQKLIEQQNPGLTFDWDAIVNTPMPPPDMTEYWRERRKAEKAARQERRAMEAEEAATVVDGTDPDTDADASETDGESLIDAPEVAELVTETTNADASSAAAEGGDDTGAARKRRRRRGGRRRRGSGAEAAAGDSTSPASTTDVDASAETGADDGEIDPSEAADPASEGE